MHVGPLARRGRSGKIEIHVIRDDEIEVAVAVVVDERTTGAPGLTGSRDAGFLRNLGEHSVIVVVEPVLAVVGDVEIFPSVVVVVADAHALAPAGCRTGRL